MYCFDGGDVPHCDRAHCPRYFGADCTAVAFASLIML
jgi:hypothetical protein